MRVGQPGGPSGAEESKKSKGPEGKKDQKEFKPKEKVKEKESQSREGEAVAEKEQGMKAGREAAEAASVAGAKAAAGTQGATRIDAVNKLILDNAADLHVGETSALLTLGVDAPDVPEALQGATIQLELGEEGLVVNINLAEGASEKDALMLMENNKAQLATLADNLQQKGINLHQMNMGTTQVALPEAVARVEVEPPKSIFEMQQEKGREEQERGREEREGEE